jgi:hypothetical protein
VLTDEIDDDPAVGGAAGGAGAGAVICYGFEETVREKKKN